MSQHNGLWGVMLGAAIVGATLIVRDALDNPQTAEVVRTKVNHSYQHVKSKVNDGCTLLREKVQEGCAVAREKAGEAGETILQAVANDPTVQKIQKKVKDLRHAAEPVETDFAEAEKAEKEAEACKNDNNAETVVEVEAGIRDPESAAGEK